MKNQQRLKTLDGFRAIAILSVLLYHFFSRWIFDEHSSLYPYGNRYNFFPYGYLGVRFFFLISGFVIFFTLEATDSFRTFWIRRGIRLVPTMVIASLVTLVVLRLFDTAPLFPAGHSMANLLPSVTFLPPALYSALLPSGSRSFDYINGSYWSLWPEIQFYVLASTLYYLNRKRFLRNFTIVSLVLIGFYWFTGNIYAGNTFHIHLSPAFNETTHHWLTDFFTLPQNLVYFATGSYFYVLYKRHSAKEKLSLPVVLSLLVFIVILLYFGVQWRVRVIYAVMVVLFFAFVYRPQWLRMLESRVVVEIGVASYAIYLFHESMGVLLIHSLAGYFSPVEFIFPLLLIGFISIVCILYTYTIEKSLADWLKGALIGKKRIKIAIAGHE